MFDLNVFEIIGIAAVFLGAIFMLVWLFYSFQSARISFGAWQRRRKNERATREAAARIAPNINVTVRGVDEMAKAFQVSSDATRALLEALGRPRFHDGGFVRNNEVSARLTYPHACRVNFSELPNFGKCPHAKKPADPSWLSYDFGNVVPREIRMVPCRQGKDQVPPRIARELKLFDPKWARPTKTGPTLTEMELAVRVLRRMRWVIRQQREEHAALRAANAKMQTANVELAAGASAKSLPPRLPALYTTWVCAKAPEIGDPPKVLENAVGTSWRVDGLRRVEDPSYHVVTLVGLSEGFNATSLHVPLEMFRSHFSRPDTAHKDS